MAAFDWALQPRWEALTASNARVKTGLPSVESDASGTGSEALSPSVPGSFLVDAEYLFGGLGGGLDEMLFSSYYGQENVELAIRTWVSPCTTVSLIIFRS